MSSSHEVVSEIERRHIISLLEHGKRFDGRTLKQIRPIEIEVGLIEKAEGSARVKLGNTQVVAGVKTDVGPPFPDTPDQAVFTTTAEFIPLASPTFEPGPPNENAIELARVVDRGIRESKCIDIKSETMVFIPGEKVRILFLDVYILDYDGNLFDASALGAAAAFLNTKIKKGEVNAETGEVELLDEYIPLPLDKEKIPVTTTFARINNYQLLDPCLAEERVMDTRITFAVTAEGNIVAAQKGETGYFPYEEIIVLSKLAQEKSPELHEYLRSGVGKS
ncbi:MAG: exosome complex protein Rrp42 [Candidatus Hodarchaeota archaeon]